MDLATTLSKQTTGVFMCPVCGCPVQRTTKDPDDSTVLDGMREHTKYVHRDMTLEEVLAHGYV